MDISFNKRVRNARFTILNFGITLDVKDYVEEESRI